jgi:hypothetical protein
VCCLRRGRVGFKFEDIVQAMIFRAALSEPLSRKPRFTVGLGLVRRGTGNCFGTSEVGSLLVFYCITTFVHLII